jgi:hypothetical protein
MLDTHFNVLIYVEQSWRKLIIILTFDCNEFRYSTNIINCDALPPAHLDGPGVEVQISKIRSKRIDSFPTSHTTVQEQVL